MAKRGSFIQRAKDLAAEYAYAVTLACVIGVIVGSAVYTQRVQRRTQEALVQAAAGAPEVLASVLPSPTPATTPLPTIVPLAVRVSVFEERGIWPVGGDVLRGHEMNEMVWWEALGVWQAHRGVDVAGAAGESVLCAADGTVERVARDALWGASAEIAQKDGRRVVYRGLALCYVEAGDVVLRGQEIGTLLERIPCEGEMGAHLHLEMEREGRAQDPLTMLEEK